MTCRMKGPQNFAILFEHSGQRLLLVRKTMAEHKGLLDICSSAFFTQSHPS